MPLPFQEQGLVMLNKFQQIEFFGKKLFKMIILAKLKLEQLMKQREQFHGKKPA